MVVTTVTRPTNSRRSTSFKSNDVADTFVESQKDAALLSCSFQDDSIRRTREFFLSDRMGCMAKSQEHLGNFSRQVFVDLEPHCESNGIRVSSRANSAA